MRDQVDNATRVREEVTAQAARAKLIKLIHRAGGPYSAGQSRAWQGPPPLLLLGPPYSIPPVC
jgi:hypothetical protein